MCLVRLQVISIQKESLFKDALQHQTRENTTEILRKHFEIIEM